MILPVVDRHVICIDPTPGLIFGRRYTVKHDGFDRLTKAPMVVLAAPGQTYWAWRFSPGPEKPPFKHIRFG